MLFFDLLLLILLVFGLIHGAIKGFICEVMTFVGVVLGIYLARIYSLQLGTSLCGYLDMTVAYTRPVAYVLIFVLTVVLCNVLAKVLSRFVKLVLLGWLNHLLGAVFGLFKFVLILSLLINVFAVFNEKIALVSEEKTAQSYLYSPLKNAIPAIMPFINAEDFGNPIFYDIPVADEQNADHQNKESAVGD